MTTIFDQFCLALAIDKSLSVHPAEIHGLGCGILASGFRLETASLFRQISAYIGEEMASNELIMDFFRDSLNALESDDFEFQLCLPDDDDYTLVERAESLSAWCQGFLHGYAAVQNSLSDEARELLRDLTEISQLDSSSLDTQDSTESDEDENERHYAELTEFVRLATVSLFMDNNEPGTLGETHVLENEKHVRH